MTSKAQLKETSGGVVRVARQSVSRPDDEEEEAYTVRVNAAGDDLEPPTEPAENKGESLARCARPCDEKGAALQWPSLFVLVLTHTDVTD